MGDYDPTNYINYIIQIEIEKNKIHRDFYNDKNKSIVYEAKFGNKCK